MTERVGRELCRQVPPGVDNQVERIVTVELEGRGGRWEWTALTGSKKPPQAVLPGPGTDLDAQSKVYI